MKITMCVKWYHAGFIAILGLLTSCSPAIYNANSLNVPLLSQKGNAKIAIGTTIGTEDIILFNNNLQSAYAISDHWGLMVNGMYHDYKRSYTSIFGSTSTTDRHREGFVEAGAGYYSNIGNSSKWRWECYSGFGIGKAKETNPNNDNAMILTSPYNRFFLQPSIGFVSNHFEAALSVRGSYLSVGKIDWVGDDTHGKTVRGALWEPCLTLRAGGKKVKPFLQYSWLFFEDNLSPVIDASGFLGRFLTLQVGVGINLNK